MWGVILPAYDGERLYYLDKQMLDTPNPNYRPNKWRPVVLLSSLLLILAGLSFLFRGFVVEDNPPAGDLISPGGTTTPPHLNYTLSESAPVRLRIPVIGVDAGFEELGLGADGQIEVPKGYEGVGWYIYGPTPGELGPAVVLGHVDSYKGPAVFFSLGQLKPGDLVEIERRDGKTAVFQVNQLERYPQSEFPTALVYSDLDYAGLRLITCSGIYNKETNQYNLNLIVYASLVEVR